MYEERDWGRYESRNGASRHPIPTTSWQEREYARVMGQEPPAGDDPQFQYNPRTKAGKALLSDLVASEGVSK